jgi:hypothetical protein
MYEMNTWWDRNPEEAVRWGLKMAVERVGFEGYTVFNWAIIGYIKVSFGDGNEAFQPFEKSLRLHS